MPSEEKERSSARAWVVGALVFGPLLYVLSVGPVAWVCIRTGVAPEPVATFYAPLDWLHENTPLEKPLEWYAELWGVR